MLHNLHQTLKKLCDEIGSLIERSPTRNFVPPTPLLGIDFEDEEENEEEEIVQTENLLWH